jgi:hypothetical protein
MINENGAKCAQIKGIENEVFKLVTDNEDGTLSAWFATFEGIVPEKDEFININKFRFTAVPKASKFPVKLTIIEWEYYLKA